MATDLKHGVLFFTILFFFQLSQGGKVTLESDCTRENGGDCTLRAKRDLSERGTTPLEGRIVPGECYTSTTFFKAVPSGYRICGIKTQTISSDKRRFTGSTEYCRLAPKYGVTSLTLSVSPFCSITHGYRTPGTLLLLYVKYCCDGTTLSPSPPGSYAKSEWLNLHNAARANFGVPALTWDVSLASAALVWVQNLAKEGCIISDREPLGARQNLAWLPGGSTLARNAVDSWVNKRIEYTEIVRMENTKLGCALDHCPSYVTALVCRYSN